MITITINNHNKQKFHKQSSSVYQDRDYQDGVGSSGRYNTNTNNSGRIIEWNICNNRMKSEEKKKYKKSKEEKTKKNNNNNENKNNK